MSWNAHTDYIFNQFPGQLSYLQLSGPDGSKWGESGTAVTVNGSDLAATAKTPTGGLKTQNGKYMFLRSMDEFSAFNKSGKGAAVLKAGTYIAIAFAGDGYKAEQCVLALEKLKAYLSGIGYN